MVFYLVILLKLLCLEACQEASKPSSFEKYISNYPVVELPFAFTYDSMIVERNTLPIADSVVEQFIGKKVLSQDLHPYAFQYLACPIRNDSLIGVIYKKAGGAGGIDIIIEMCIYDDKTNGIVDRIMLGQILEGGDSQKLYEGFIGKDLIVTQNLNMYRFDYDQSKRVLQKHQTNQLKITAKGFIVVQGEKVKPSNW